MAAKEKTEINAELSDLEIMRYILKTLYGGERDDLTMRLIERFGGATEVFGASYAELLRVDGMTERTASFFTFIKPLYRQALLRSAPNFKADSEAALVRYASVYFMNERTPREVCLYLDKADKIICTERLSEENRTAEILSGVCRHGAAKIVLLRFIPHEDDLSVLRTIDGLETVSSILSALDLIDAAPIDYIEYFPFGFFALHRALDGDDGIVAAQSASERKYTKAESLTEPLQRYIKTLKKRLIEKRAH